MKKIKTGVKWVQPNSHKTIVTEYILSVPKGVSKNFYLWISTGMRLPYKTQCLMNRLMKKKEYLFKPNNTTSIDKNQKNKDAE